jgi:hypothetical protein
MNDTPDLADAVNPAANVDNTTENFESPNWREVLPVHPAAELFPLMKETDPEGFRELVEDIKKNGLRQPIAIYHDSELGTCLLDGRNRLDALELLDWEAGGKGFDLPSEFWQVPNHVLVGLDDWRDPDPTFDPYAYVVSANVHRRHLTAEQRRDLIAKVLKARPEASNLQIAKQVKADDKTVAKVRAELEARSEIPNVETRIDARGRKQPARRHTPEPTPPEPKAPGIVVPLKDPASKPITSDQFMDRALPTFRDVYCAALTEIAKSDPAGARDCAAKMHAAIDEAIEVAHDDHPMGLQ